MTQANDPRDPLSLRDRLLEATYRCVERFGLVRKCRHRILRGRFELLAHRVRMARQRSECLAEHRLYSGDGKPVRLPVETSEHAMSFMVVSELAPVCRCAQAIDLVGQRKGVV